MNENRNGQTELELYIHIPFCVRKCGYCDFVSAPAGREVQQAYMERLWEEIEESVNGETLVSSVFFGGGTPSLIEPLLIEETLNRIRRRFFLSPDAEISMEANPGTLTKEALQIYKRAGVNRLSIGLQSAHNKELSMLGRIHTWEEFKESFSLARRAGFENLNVDLMAALPGQTVESFSENLRAVLALSPEHLSVYSLIIEEETPFYETYGKQAEARAEGREDAAIRPLPSEEDERTMYRITEELLGKAGYDHYEISNYSKPGYACRHNIGYWTGTPYLGFGISAASYIEEKRFHNTSDREEYLSRPFSEIRSLEEQVTRPRAMEEFLFLGLRMMCGVSEQRFLERFGITMEAVYGETLKTLSGEGLLEAYQNGTERFWRLTEYGIDVSNYVLAEFLLDEN